MTPGHRARAWFTENGELASCFHPQRMPSWAGSNPTDVIVIEPKDLRALMTQAVEMAREKRWFQNTPYGGYDTTKYTTAEIVAKLMGDENGK